MYYYNVYNSIVEAAPRKRTIVERMTVHRTGREDRAMAEIRKDATDGPASREEKMPNMEDKENAELSKGKFPYGKCEKKKTFCPMFKCYISMGGRIVSAHICNVN